MRKGLMALATAGLMLSASTHAANDDVVEGMKDKAVSGAIDAVTGIVELPMQVLKGYKNGCAPIKNPAASKTVGTILGIFRGFGHAAGRTSWGFMELFGFWTVNHEDNDGSGVPLDAQYAWEQGDQYSILKPTLGEGVKPIGTKLCRGLADGFLGVAELPGQIMKGIDDGKPVQGVVNGFWYMFSRQVYGFGSVFTCLVPNPIDNPGVAFNGEWPWTTLADQID